MRRRVMRALVTAGTAVVCGVLGVATAGAASAVTTEGEWRFDEPAGATAALDSSGYGQNGAVGGQVQTGVARDGAVGYRFGPFSGGWQAVIPGRLVTWADSNRLDAGTGRFAVTVRFRTSATGGNIVQKGQTGTLGGHWKVELFRGFARCSFQDSNKVVGAITSSLWVDNDVWNTVTCERTRAGVAVIVDGVRKSRSVTLGTIDNKVGMAVGGKTKCDGVSVSCDYFVGDIDYIRITRG